MNKTSAQTNKQQQHQVLFWLIVAVSITLAILALQEILLPFVTGSILAYALNPVADRLERLGIGRTAASAIVVCLLFIAFAAIVIILVPLLIQQTQQVVESLPSDIESIKPTVQDWLRNKLGNHFEAGQNSLEQIIKEIRKNWAGLIGQIAHGVWNGGWAILDLLAITLITPVVVFYLLVDWPHIIKHMSNCLPRDHEAKICKVFSSIDSVLAAFIRGQGLVCLILGLFYTTCLTLVGLRYGLLIGIVTGILSFIPIVGSTIGFLTASLLGIIQGWPDPTLLMMVFAIFATGQIMDSCVLAPRIIGRTVGLHPVTIIFALFIFSYFYGFVGTIVAVPISAVIGVILRFGLEIYLSSSIYKGQSGDAEKRIKTPIEY
ncbi:MAG: hypothetical protein TECD_00406 [Hyphomicrobiaceae bacterium hypho_1]